MVQIESKDLEEIRAMALSIFDKEDNMVIASVAMCINFKCIDLLRANGLEPKDIA